MSVESPQFTSKAREAWGEDLPDWVLVLAENAEASSLNKVAKHVGVSASQLSQIITGKYAGRYDVARDAIRYHYMREVVACPMLGELASNVCTDWQAKARDFQPTSSHRVKMARACRGCPRFIAAENADV